MAPRLLGEASVVELALDSQAGSCEVDLAQFASALLNLVVNARDAMPGGGRLTIRSANLILDARRAAKIPDAHPGEYVVVEVADTGTGMSSEVLQRATEPFFTMKAPGQGTGLGLSQVYGFTRQSGGFLIKSRSDAGTTIRIHLPAPSSALSAPEEHTPAHAGSGLVLVVEDGEDVRMLVVAQLEDFGYRAVAVASGPDALEELSGTEPPGFDLLLTDFGMPGGMNGVELVRAARQRQPGLKALLTSGYAPGLGSGSKGEHVPLLLKPYQQADLARAIADALATDAPT